MLAALLGSAANSRSAAPSEAWREGGFMKRPQDILRCCFAVMFGLGAMANAIMAWTNPDLYRGFADLSLLSAYREVWQEHAFPNIRIMIGLVVVFEATVCALLLSRGKAVVLGAALGAAFMVFLIPFWWAGAGLVNLVLLRAMTALKPAP